MRTKTISVTKEKESTTPIINIRKGRLSYLDRLISLSKRTKELTDHNGEIMGKRIFRKWIKEGFCLVLEKNGEINGFIIGEYHKNSHYSYILYLVVSPKLRGKGLGRELIFRYLQECKRHRVKYIDLMTPTTARKTIKFYKKLGFELGHKYLYCCKKIK